MRKIEIMLGCLIIAGVCIFGGMAAKAQHVPNKINYQGFLKTTEDVPVFLYLLASEDSDRWIDNQQGRRLDHDDRSWWNRNGRVAE